MVSGVERNFEKVAQAGYCTVVALTLALVHVCSARFLHSGFYR